MEMTGLAQLIGFELDYEPIIGTEFDHISHTNLRRIFSAVCRKRGEVLRLTRRYEALTAQQEANKADVDKEKKERLEAEIKQVNDNLNKFSVSVDELLAGVEIVPAALARAAIGGLEVLVPINRSDGPYELLPSGYPFSKQSGPLDKVCIHYLACDWEKTISTFTTRYKKDEGSKRHPLARLHFAFVDSHSPLEEGYNTGGSIDRVFAAGEIASITIRYTFDIRQRVGEQLYAKRAKTEIEVSFPGKHRGVRHNYLCDFVYNPDADFPYSLDQALHIENKKGGHHNNLCYKTKVHQVKSASEVKRYAAALATVIGLVTKQDGLERKIEEIAALYRDLFHTELREFEQQGLNLGPEGYLAPKPGILRRLFGL